MELVMELPSDGAKIISMISHNGVLYVATERQVFELCDDEFCLVAFAVGGVGE
jgi:hypothetical protein